MRHLYAAILTACTSTSSATPPSVSKAHNPPVVESQKVAPSTARVIAKLGDAANPAKVTAVRVVAAVGDEPASERPAYARKDQTVTLYAVVTAELSGKRTIYSDAPALRLGGKAVAIEPLAKAPQIELRWNRIEPAVNDMSNGATPSDFHFHTIDYRATPIDDAAGKPSATADV